MKKPIIVTIFALMCLVGCKSTSQKAINEPPNSGPLSPELEAALNNLVTSTETKKIKADCPSEVVKYFKAEESLSAECGAVQVPHFYDKVDGLNVSVAYLLLRKNTLIIKPLLVIEQGGAWEFVYDIGCILYL